MTPLHVRPLTVAIVVALTLVWLAPIASAQQQQEPKTTEQMTMREKRAQRQAEIRGESGTKNKNKKTEGEAKPALYPNSTRVSPETRSSGKILKELQALQEAFEKQDMAGVITKAEGIAGDPAANSYEKSFAYSLAANAAADLDDQVKAEDYFRKAIDANGLDNDNQFTSMFNLAVIQYGLEKYQDALATLDRFLAESKSEKLEHQSFRAGILANLDRNEEAAAAYQALIKKNPDDKRLLMNAVAALQSADNFDEANVLLEDAYKRGMLTEPRELRALYVGYMNTGRWNDVRAVILEGVSKGILQPNPELARDYMVLAQNAYAEDNITLAIEMYTKAGPIAADGEAYLNLAKVLEYSGKNTEAKVAAQKALDKGLQKPEEAKRILSR